MKKLYIFDDAWCGAAICVAESKKEAYEKMMNADLCYAHKEDLHEDVIDEYDLDVVAETIGDF